jgi:hypothetical protein
MKVDQLDAYNDIINQLINIAQVWAMRGKFDSDYARELREKALLINHAHYVERIPAYRRFVQEEGLEQVAEIDDIKNQLMVPDDLFKSYNQSWLDEDDYDKMNGWISQIFHLKVDVDVEQIHSIDEWIERLGVNGIRIVYSSGTSGTFSFIPRDHRNWTLFRTASTCYIVPLIMYEKVGTSWQRFLMRLATRMLKPSTFEKIAKSGSMASEFDAIFLDFSQGSTGNQVLERELAPLFRKHYYLYETDLSPSVLRLATRGAKSAEDRYKLMKLKEAVVDRKEENYCKAINHLKQATSDGQKVFMFGTTHQYKELCETIASSNERISLREGSMVLFGGGWKSFTGEKISRQELVSMMSTSLDLPPERILEGYSMTEINAFMLRCDFGRFHIPPTIEPCIFNDELSLIDGDDVHGIFGFLDPLALSYPGFIISGDEVHFVNGECPCGLVGPAVTEIGRAHAREVKGCGGIMASIAA